jgi:hypothetical protein
MVCKPLNYMNELMLMNMPPLLARKCGKKPRMTLMGPRIFSANCQSIVLSSANFFIALRHPPERSAGFQRESTLCLKRHKNRTPARLHAMCWEMPVITKQRANLFIEVASPNLFERPANSHRGLF